MEIPCSEKSAKSETSVFELRFFYIFFEMPLQKNVKTYSRTMVTCICADHAPFAAAGNFNLVTALSLAAKFTALYKVELFCARSMDLGSVELYGSEHMHF